MSEMKARIEAAFLKGMRERWNPPAIARLILEAMREPTDGMAQAASVVPDDDRNVDQIGVGGAACVWRAMIDKALEG